jgi:D-alanine-D-alanine ligase
LQIAVLGGGISAEHEVSLRSAREVFRALDRGRYRVRPVFVARDGRWHVAAGPRAAEPSAIFDAALGPPCWPGAAVAALREAGVGLVFPALHGRGGEDGSLQGMLDLHGIAYVGSGTAASAVGMDKLRTRECLSTHAVPMAAAVLGAVPHDRASLDAVLDEIEGRLGLPCFVKMDLSGSSYGVARCGDRAAIAAFFAAERGRRFVAEALLVGEEISVPVLGNAGGPLRALPPVGIYPLQDPYFDVRAKYEPGRTEELIPPRGLDPGGIEAVQQLAIRCHALLGCDGATRTDMILTAAGPRVLEVNTLPGMTPQSLLPQCAAAAGIDFPSLLDELIALALARRHAEDLA